MSPSLLPDKTFLQLGSVPDSPCFMSISAKQCLKHLKPFLPFFLISGMIAVLYFILDAIVHSGPFTDEHFFEKFERRWPKPLALNKNGST